MEQAETCLKVLAGSCRNESSNDNLATMLEMNSRTAYAPVAIYSLALPVWTSTGCAFPLLSMMHLPQQGIVDGVGVEGCRTSCLARSSAMLCFALVCILQVRTVLEESSIGGRGRCCKASGSRGRGIARIGHWSLGGGRGSNRRRRLGGNCHFGLYVSS